MYMILGEIRKPIFRFEFNMDLISDQEAIANPSLEFPAGLIYFDLKQKNLRGIKNILPV